MLSLPDQSGALKCSTTGVGGRGMSGIGGGGGARLAECLICLAEAF